MTKTTEILKPTEGFEYYKGEIYWNDFEAVKDYFSNCISGEVGTSWYSFLQKKYGSFKNALIVNCGNGWVERDLFMTGAIAAASGFDINPQLVELAQEEARRSGMPFQYFVADANSTDPIDGDFDLIINHGAVHHVAFLDRLTRRLYLAVDRHTGLYAMMDYTGPHRNQYSWEAWSAALTVNSQLPPEFSQDLDYPHVKTMLATDLTEAIHSDLQIEILERYFDIQDRAQCGGAIAYPILSGNKRLYAARETPEGQAALKFILDEDRKMTLKSPSTNLFTFCTARPKLNALFDRSRLYAWREEEIEREHRALMQAGRYEPPTALELIYNRLYDIRDLAMVT